MDYQKRINLALQNGVIDTGTLTHINVQHDDDCPIMHGSRECFCDAKVIVKSNDGDMYIDEDGYLHKLN